MKFAKNNILSLKPRYLIPLLCIMSLPLGIAGAEVLKAVTSTNIKSIAQNPQTTEFYIMDGTSAYLVDAANPILTNTVAKFKDQKVAPKPFTKFYAYYPSTIHVLGLDAPNLLLYNYSTNIVDVTYTIPGTFKLVYSI